jgi:type III restriction enzyme
MGSPDQVTQIIGRVLRQPGAQHYPTAILNTAHFYIRTDEKGVFEDIIDDVKRKLTTEAPDITLTIAKSTHGGTKPTRPALKRMEVPTVSINSADAKDPINDIVRVIPTYKGDTEDTVGKGGRIQILQTIGNDSAAKEEWVEVEHSNRVTARWRGPIHPTHAEEGSTGRDRPRQRKDGRCPPLFLPLTTMSARR